LLFCVFCVGGGGAVVDVLNLSLFFIIYLAWKMCFTGVVRECCFMAVLLLLLLILLLYDSHTFKLAKYN